MIHVIIENIIIIIISLWVVTTVVAVAADADDIGKWTTDSLTHVHSYRIYDCDSQ